MHGPEDDLEDDDDINVAAFRVVQDSVAELPEDDSGPPVSAPREDG
jgi:hypothetical protein